MTVINTSPTPPTRRRSPTASSCQNIDVDLCLNDIGEGATCSVFSSVALKGALLGARIPMERMMMMGAAKTGVRMQNIPGGEFVVRFNELHCE